MVDHVGETIYSDVAERVDAPDCVEIVQEEHLPGEDSSSNLVLDSIIWRETLWGRGPPSENFHCKVPKRSTGRGCKPLAFGLRWFESTPCNIFLKTGCGITVARLPWEQKAKVRLFPSRPKKLDSAYGVIPKSVITARIANPLWGGNALRRGRACSLRHCLCRITVSSSGFHPGHSSSTLDRDAIFRIIFIHTSTHMGTGSSYHFTKVILPAHPCRIGSSYHFNKTILPAAFLSLVNRTTDSSSACRADYQSSILRCPARNLTDL